MGARLCLVDGTYELFRGYFGAPSRKTPEGQEIAATLAVGRSLHRLAQSDDVTHFAVAFDSEIESFRNELFEGYKTGEGIEEELHSQFPLIEELCEALGFFVFRMRRYEADDALAAMAARFVSSEELEQIVIASPDKDLTQCVVGQRVVTWDRMRERTYDQEGVLERMGVPPESVPDYLALVGDSADGIPGIPRWGAKSTAIVLQRYGHLEAIPDEEGQWDIKVRGAKTLAENLAAARKEALLYRQLATLVTDVGVTPSLSDLRVRAPDEARVRDLAQRWGAQTLERLLS